VNPPKRVLTTSELIGYQAQALSKHRSFVQHVRERVDANKITELKKFEQKYRAVIKDWDFKPGQLVQVRNSTIEKNLDRKMYVQYRGPMVVIRRTKGGAYIIAEMDGSVLCEKVAAFHVIPHHSHYEPIELPEDIHELIDLNKQELEALVEDETKPQELDYDLIFDAIPNLRLTEDDAKDGGKDE
jgi:intein/homing endonuclease